MVGGFLAKLLLTFLVIVVVWRGMRLWKETQARLAAAEADRRRRERATPAALDLAPCPLCGTYVPPGARCASREACRYRRPAA